MSQTKPVYASFRSIGAYVPEKILSNADLEKMVDTTDEWIVKRTGITARESLFPWLTRKRSGSWK